MSLLDFVEYAQNTMPEVYESLKKLSSETFEKFSENNSEKKGCNNGVGNNEL